MQHLLLIVLFGSCCTTSAFAAYRLPPQQQGQGQQDLESEYQQQLEALRAELQRAMPAVSDRKKAAFLKAIAAEKEAEAASKAAQQSNGKVATAEALVGHAKGKWIGGADRGIQKAKAQLESASTAEERTAALKELVKWQDNRKEGMKALKERQAALVKAKREQPKLKRAAKAAASALKKAEARAARALNGLGLRTKLAQDTLDARLAKFIVLSESTPQKLAAFARQGSAQRQLVDRLLADSDLMLQMVVADGAKDAAYGRAMEIYTQIQSLSKRAHEGPLQRLAVAVALEHAVAISQRNPVAASDAPATIDPVARYKHYEEAFLTGELDPCFGRLSGWDYRMVVDGSEPDEILGWGREMLQSYRPDHIYTKDYRWRYVAAVRTDIRYGSQDNKHDKPELQFFQNILMNGGVCGRRAFFGRFLLRAFGVPTTARPQRGHAALAHWTPDGWVVCLGAGWGGGWTKTRYRMDLDFLATTQARRDQAGYLQVKRAQWLGDVAKEKRVFGLLSGTPGFWYGVSLYRQRQIVADSKAVTLEAVGTELGEAEDLHGKYAAEAAEVTESDRQINVDSEGVITIPAVACSKPAKSNGKVIFMPSNLGGKQLHYGRNGRGQDIEYTFDVATAGAYTLTARVASASWQQHLEGSVNGAAQSFDIELPHTVGLWGESDPVQIELIAGRNVIKFRHKSDGHAKGFSIKDFVLKPKS